MKSVNRTARKAFLANLLDAGQRPSLSFRHVIWTSRWSILQWLFVIATLAVLIGPAYSQNVVCLGVGLLLGFLLNLQRSLTTWPWLLSVIDWDKVEREVSSDAYEA